MFVRLEFRKLEISTIKGEFLTEKNCYLKCDFIGKILSNKTKLETINVHK